MTRDFDLVRSLLVDLEKEGEEIYVEHEHGAEVIHQLLIMRDAGFIEAEDRGFGEVYVRRLTWEGHDFLDSVRDDTVWNKTKSKVSKSVGSASLEVVRAVADGITRSIIGLP